MYLDVCLEFTFKCIFDFSKIPSTMENTKFYLSWLAIGSKIPFTVKPLLEEWKMAWLVVIAKTHFFFFLYKAHLHISKLLTENRSLQKWYDMLVGWIHNWHIYFLRDFRPPHGMNFPFLCNLSIFQLHFTSCKIERDSFVMTTECGWIWNLKSRVLYKFWSTWEIQLTAGGLTLEEYLLSHRKSSILQTYPSTVTQDGCYFILI